LFVTHYEILVAFVCILLYAHSNWSQDFEMADSYVGEEREESGKENSSKWSLLFRDSD
jgi:hypothetical protein